MKYVGTYSDPKDIVTKDKLEAVASRVSTNEDNIAMAESDIDGLQNTVSTLQTNVNNVQTALTSKQDIVVGGASTITEDNLTASRALISNSSGKVAVSTVTSTELGYLDGVTSNVQTQLNKKLEKAPVQSVNNKTGTVSLTASDVSAIPSTLTGTAGQVLTKTADGQEWKDATSPQPSTTTPLAPTEAGSVGTSTAYARGDHVHPKQAVTKSDVGLGNVDNVSINTRMNRTTNVNASDTNYTTLMTRGEKLMAQADFDAVTDWSQHLVDGAIAWGYE